MVTNMICSHQTLLNQNQRTIDSMEARDYCGAVVSSSSALEYHHGSIEAMRRERMQQTSSRPALSYDQCMLLADIDESNNEDNDGIRCFIYDQAIPLPATVADPETISPILIFNAALAHHLFARHCNNETSILYLQKAYALYSLAYEAPDMDENPLFQFAVINNAAVIDLQLSNNTESWDANMEYLVCLYMVLMDRGCTSMLRRMQGILVNAVPSSPVAHVA